MSYLTIIYEFMWDLLAEWITTQIVECDLSSHMITASCIITL